MKVRKPWGTGPWSGYTVTFHHTPPNYRRRGGAFKVERKRLFVGYLYAGYSIALRTPWYSALIFGIRDWRG